MELEWGTGRGGSLSSAMSDMCVISGDVALWRLVLFCSCCRLKVHDL